MVSVIIPAYNAEKSIIKCLNSVINQTYTNIEIIVIDDGSTDNTVKLCEQLKQNDERIHIYHFENHGVSWARNKGITLSKGDFIIFADSDDWMEHDMIEKLVHFSGEADLVICGINAIDVRNGSNTLYLFGEKKCDIYEYIGILEKKNINIFLGGIYNKLYDKNIIRSSDVSFEIGHTFGEDFCFNIDYLRGCHTIYIVAEGLYNYIYNNNNSLTVDNFYKMSISSFWKQELFVYNKYIQFLDYYGIESNYLILLELWRIFISKVNKNFQVSHKERLEILCQCIKKHGLKKKLNAIKTHTIKDKISIKLYTNKTILYLLTWFLDIKHIMKN